MFESAFNIIKTFDSLHYEAVSAASVDLDLDVDLDVPCCSPYGWTAICCCNEEISYGSGTCVAESIAK